MRLHPHHSARESAALFLELVRFTPKPPNWAARLPLSSEPSRYHPSVMKIEMMLHFAVTVSPFTPERCRTSPAYTQFVKELLKDGLIERPTDEQRLAHPGWAYKATAKGKAYVEALKNVQLPVAKTEWIIPQ